MRSEFAQKVQAIKDPQDVFPGVGSFDCVRVQAYSSDFNIFLGQQPGEPADVILVGV